MKQTALAIICGALFLLWILEKCERDPEPVTVVPQVVRDSLNDLIRRDAQRDSASVRADSIEAALRRLAQQQADRARNSERATALARRGSDSLRRVLAESVTAADSVPVLVAVVAKQDTVIARQDTTIFSLKQQSLALMSQVGVVSQQRDSMRTSRDEWRGTALRFEGLATKAEKQMADMEPKCYIVARIRCPSRTESAILGVLVGVGGIVAAANAGG